VLAHQGSAGRHLWLVIVVPVIVSAAVLVVPVIVPVVSIAVVMLPIVVIIIV